ncbi:MAG TPA: RNase adapter RapZ [Nannocystis exedens]|nr:RNase adapter RapZ [Nannocystis exedens]
MELLVVTGMSGAGKSTALDALEDIGFYCVDNVPVPLLPELVSLAQSRDSQRRLAVGIDAREPSYLRDFAAVQEHLEAAGHRVEVLFLEAPTDVLVRRYSETRRKHPQGHLPQAIDDERQLLQGLRTRTTATIDTATLKARELRQMIRDRYGTRGVLHLVLMSFGFKSGLPTFADLVFDVRFLVNPYYISELRHQSGLDAAVADYVLRQPESTELLEHLEGLLRFMVPATVREGRSYLTVAIGCTGGQHRSVALTERLAARLLETEGEPLSRPPPQLIVRHRDIIRS